MAVHNTAHTRNRQPIKKKEHEILFYTDRQQGRMDAVRLPPYGRLCVRLYPWSVGISVHDYDLWTEETRPIAERTLEHIRQSMNV